MSVLPHTDLRPMVPVLILSLLLMSCAGSFIPLTTLSEPEPDDRENSAAESASSQERREDTSVSRTPPSMSLERNQVSHFTREDRYPEVYNATVRLSLNEAPKILSFGASTGDEANTIAQKYFLRSVIVGVDVDDVTLAQAREKCAKFSDRVFMFNGLRWPLNLLGTYDIIFANSVLCSHTGGPDDQRTSITERYPFSLFQNTVLQLHQSLRMGGILVMVNSNYRLEDTSVANAYRAEPSLSTGCKMSNFVPLYTPDGALRPEQSEHACIYIKQRP